MPNHSPQPTGCASGFRGSALLAINMSAAKGDITNSDAILWKYDRDTPYVPSLLLYKDLLYFMKNTRGLLSCLNAKTGEVHYGPERLEGIMNIYASPVAANDHVYLSGREGTTLVIKHGPQFEIVASNKLEDGIDASLAIVGNELFIRGNKYLYCIAE